MPHLEGLVQQSLRDYGLLATVILLTAIYGLVFLWRRPPPTPHTTPMQAIAEQVKLIPLVLEETRENGREIRDLKEMLEHAQDRLERMEMLGNILKDRTDRSSR